MWLVAHDDLQPYKLPGTCSSKTGRNEIGKASNMAGHQSVLRFHAAIFYLLFALVYFVLKLPI